MLTALTLDQQDKKIPEIKSHEVTFGPNAFSGLPSIQYLNVLFEYCTTTHLRALLHWIAKRSLIGFVGALELFGIDVLYCQTKARPSPTRQTSRQPLECKKTKPSTQVKTCSPINKRFKSSCLNASQAGLALHYSTVTECTLLIRICSLDSRYPINIIRIIGSGSHIV